MRLLIAFTKTGSHWYVKAPQTTADSMTSTVETRQSCLNTASWRTKPKFSTFTFDVRTLGRSWPLCSMGKTWSQPVRSRVADWPNFKAVLPAKFSSKHHKNQMLLWVQTWRPGKLWPKCHGLCALHEAAPDSLHAPRSSFDASKWSAPGLRCSRVKAKLCSAQAWRKTSAEGKQ